MIIMTREVEKLRAELANAEKRARAAAANPSNLTFLIIHSSILQKYKLQFLFNLCFLIWIFSDAGPGYAANTPEMGFGGITYPPDSYSMHQVCESQSNVIKLYIKRSLHLK